MQFPLVTGFAGLAFSVLVATSAHAQQNWQGYHYLSSAAPTAYRGTERLANAIREETKGAINIKMNVGGSLPIQATNITQAVGDGILHFAADGFPIGNVPITGVMRLPMLFASQEEFFKASEAVMPAIEKAYLKRGVVVLAQYVYPLQVAWSTRKMTSVADMSDQKFRVTSPEQGEFVKRLGGSAITIGTPEVSSALASGVVNGAFTASSGGGRIWKDQLKYRYSLGPNYFNAMIIVNKDAWDKLPQAQRDTVKAAAQRVTREITAEMNTEEAELTRQMAAGGMVVTEATPEAFAEAAKRMPPVWDAWSAKHDADSKQALATIRSLVKR